MRSEIHRSLFLAVVLGIVCEPVGAADFPIPDGRNVLQRDVLSIDYRMFFSG